MFEDFLTRLENGTKLDSPAMVRSVKEGDTVFLMAFPATRADGTKTLMELSHVLRAVDRANASSFFDTAVGEALGKESWNIGLMPATIQRFTDYFIAISPGGAHYANGIVSLPSARPIHHDYTQPGLYTWGIKDASNYYEAYELEYVIYRALHSTVCAETLLPLFIHGVSTAFSLDDEERSLFIKTYVSLQDWIQHRKSIFH